MNTIQKPDRSLAKAKEEPIIKLGLDVHAAQITVRPGVVKHMGANGVET